MGADHVINHHKPVAEQVQALGLEPRYVASLNGTERNFPEYIKLIQPRGHIAVIDDPKVIDIRAVKLKALTFSWEFMFTRPMYKTADMDKQQELLNRVSKVIDEGTIASIMTKNLGKLSVETLVKAHVDQESGKLFGKQVLEGFKE
jgi:NADPH2:quinone reductase